MGAELSQRGQVDLRAEERSSRSWIKRPIEIAFSPTSAGLGVDLLLASAMGGPLRQRFFPPFTSIARAARESVHEMPGVSAEPLTSRGEKQSTRLWLLAFSF